MPTPDRPGRRAFLYTATATAALGAGALAAWPLIDQMNPAADLGEAPINLRPIAPGRQAIVAPHGDPVFIRHRTPAEIAAAVQGDQADMPHPQLDAERVRPGHAQWLIVEGLCTLHGCVLKLAEGGFGGWACPCCGSAYDLSGRIRRGPAPRNLGVPRYQFVGEGAVRFV